ncbi:MAG TPA: tryptophan synthase subunit alpha [Thermoplasmata archaeon]|nr:tryptophan synthase subunit alpha [Thermoplasmata archaeon]
MRIDAALRQARRAGRPIVVPYVLVDRSRAARLGATVRALASGGATAVELGFPFSDPIADGPVLAAAASRALAHGTEWADLLRALRTTTAIVPAAVMTYANPVLRHGLEAGLRELASAGASGLIVPDLSLEEAPPWHRAAQRAGLSLVLLAAPAADEARVGRIARASRGFLYLVSRYGTTGRRGTTEVGGLRPLVRAARTAAPALPILLGFGVRDAATARRAMTAGVDGVVVGTALEERIATGGTAAGLGRWMATLAAGAVPRRSTPVRAQA